MSAPDADDAAELLAGLSIDGEAALRAWYTLAKEQPAVTKRTLRTAQWGDRFLIEQRFNKEFQPFEPCTITRSEDQSFVFKRYDGVYIGQDGTVNAGMAVTAQELGGPEGASLLVRKPALRSLTRAFSRLAMQ